MTREQLSIIRRSPHCVKSARIRSFSGPYFPAFGQEKLRIRTLFTQCLSSINFVTLDTSCGRWSTISRGFFSKYFFVRKILPKEQGGKT